MGRYGAELFAFYPTTASRPKQILPIMDNLCDVMDNSAIREVLDICAQRG